MSFQFTYLSGLGIPELAFSFILSAFMVEFSVLGSVLNKGGFIRDWGKVYSDAILCECNPWSH